MTAAELSELRASLATAQESLSEASEEVRALVPVLRVLPLAPDGERAALALQMARAALRDAQFELDRLSGHSVKVGSWRDDFRPDPPVGD